MSIILNSSINEWSKDDMKKSNIKKNKYTNSISADKIKLEYTDDNIFDKRIITPAVIEHFREILKNDEKSKQTI